MGGQFSHGVQTAKLELVAAGLSAPREPDGYFVHTIGGEQACAERKGEPQGRNCAALVRHARTRS